MLTYVCVYLRVQSLLEQPVMYFSRSILNPNSKLHRAGATGLNEPGCGSEFGTTFVRNRYSFPNHDRPNHDFAAATEFRDLAVRIAWVYEHELQGRNPTSSVCG